MAIATGTALAISAGISAASAGASFVQAGKQKRLSEQAQRDADKAFKEAEAQLDVNYFEQLGISKTPYENQREAIAQQAAQAMEIGRESERGGAATAGRVLAQSNVAQQNITDKQTKDLEALNKLVATEESRLGTARADLSLEQAEGAGFAAAQAQNQANQSTAAGVQGIADFGMSMLSNSELYKQNPTTPGSTTPSSNNAASFGVFSSDANQYPQVVPSQNMVNPNSFGVLASNANQYPQVVPSQNMVNPLGAFMQAGVNGSGLTQEQYLNLINPLR